MTPSTAILALLVATGLVPSTTAQNQRWLDDFAMPGVRQRVFSLGTYGSDLIAGGSPLETTGEFLGNVARYDGHHWHSLDSGVDGTVHAVQEYQGDLVVAGSFLGASGIQAIHIARWDGTSWHSMGQGIGSASSFPTVLDLEVFQGELYATGEFGTAGGVAATSIARWNGTSWAAVGTGITQAQGQWGTGRVLYATPTHLYVGGNFLRAGGLALNNIARWDGASWSSIGGDIGPNGTVTSITEFGGQLHVGGTFTYVNGSPDVFHNIARFDGSQWHDLGGGLPDGVNGVEVDDLKVYDGALYATGNFVYAGGTIGVGVTTPRLARWDGTAWSSTGGIWGSDGNEQTWPMTLWGDRVVVGGRLSFAGHTSAITDHVVSTGVIAFDGANWSSLGRGLGIEGLTNVVVPWNGGWAVGGQFSNAGDQRFSNLAFWDGGQWSTLGDTNGEIKDAVEYQGDLVVTGDFTSIGGIPISGCARFDGTTWTQLGSTSAGLTLAVHQGDLYLGAVGSPRRFDGTSWQSVGPQLFGTINDLHSYAGKLWIGGSIGAFAGPGPNLLTWDGVTMQPVGAPNRRVTGFHSFNGDLIIGGEFTQIGGVSANGVARYDGAQFAAMGGGLGGGGVFAFETVGADLYAAGSFTPFFGAPDGFIARWTGASWASLGSGLDNAPLGLAYDAGAQILYAAGGAFQRAGGKPCRAFAAWRVGPPMFRRFCESATTGCPCTPAAPAGGCPNGTQAGGTLEAIGFASVTANALTLESASLPAGTVTILFAGPSELSVPVALANGMRCVGSPVRMGPVESADAGGVIAHEDIVVRLGAALPSGMSMLAGSSWYFQDWYRDAFAPCGMNANTTNAVEVRFVP